MVKECVTHVRSLAAKIRSMAFRTLEDHFSSGENKTTIKLLADCFVGRMTNLEGHLRGLWMEANHTSTLGGRASGTNNPSCLKGGLIEGVLA